MGRPDASSLSSRLAPWRPPGGTADRGSPRRSNSRPPGLGISAIGFWVALGEKSAWDYNGLYIYIHIYMYICIRYNTYYNIHIYIYMQIITCMIMYVCNVV